MYLLSTCLIATDQCRSLCLRVVLVDSLVDGCSNCCIIGSCVLTIITSHRDKSAPQICQVSKVKICVRQSAKLKIRALQIRLIKACFVKIRVFEVAFSHVCLLKSSFVEIAVLGHNSEQINALHAGSNEIAFADIC